LLPITPYLPEIADTLSRHSNLVLQAEPGAGKSTALPLYLINHGFVSCKKIVMLEPRRVAAKSIAHYLAKQMGEQVGGRIGYQVKNERKCSDSTVLEIVTEGILTRRLQSDPELSDVGLIILDEFHERSLHSDLALMLALEVQQTLREDLKLLVMSATIDTQAISRYLNHAPVIACPGRIFPVSVDYIADSDFPDTRQLINRVMHSLEQVLSPGNTGDTLVFLPGQAAITRCLDEAKRIFGEHKQVSFLPLYGGLSIEQQEQALQSDPHGTRRVVFTTNIAETSLTIEGVTCVIDSGLEKVSVYDPVSAMSRLETRFISKASAEQRKGRAGRLQAGQCLRLWSESRQKSLQEYQAEDILNADLTSFLLDLIAWGQSDYFAINWLTPPPHAHFDSARQLLIDLTLVTTEGKLTVLGKHAVALGIHPRLAAMLLQTRSGSEKSLAIELCALLSENTLFHSTRRVDIVERMLALQDYKTNRRQALKTWPIKIAVAEQILNTATTLAHSLNHAPTHPVFSLMSLQSQIGRLLLLAYPDRLAKRRADNSGRYLLANGRGVQLFEDDPLYGENWLVVSDCNALKKEGQIFSAAAIPYETVKQSLGAGITEHDEFQLDDKKQCILGRRVTRYRAITLHAQPLSAIPGEAFQTCLADLLRSEGLSFLNWTQACKAWLARAAWLSSVFDAFPKLTEENLIEKVDQWLLPYLSQINRLEQLKQVDILPLLQACLSWEQQQILETEAPVFYTTPSGKEIAIHYDENQGPTVSVRLQEMFGELESPRIGGKQVPLRFELLSPAQRPIQTTSDLANFWHTSYIDVAKEMRGRYPKHRWPEQPLLEKPGHSIKHPRR
jgi:ATP-dependent helicase HrpB